MTIIRLIIAIVLAIGGALHAYGSVLAFPKGSPGRIWALASAAFALFLALIAAQPAAAADAGLRWSVVVGAVAWGVTVLAFGRAIGKVTDPRVSIISSLRRLWRWRWQSRAEPRPARTGHYRTYFRFSLKNFANEPCTSAVTSGWSL